jgi:hypothetical protein
VVDASLAVLLLAAGGVGLTPNLRRVAAGIVEFAPQSHRGHRGSAS